MKLLESLLLIQQLLFPIVLLSVTALLLKFGVFSDCSFQFDILSLLAVDSNDQLIPKLLSDLVGVALRIDIEKTEAREFIAHVLSLLLCLAANILSINFMQPD